MPKAFYHMLILYSWSWTDKSYGVKNYSVYNFIHDWYYDLLPKGKKIFKDSENVLKRKVDIYWYFNYLFPDF